MSFIVVTQPGTESVTRYGGLGGRGRSIQETLNLANQASRAALEGDMETVAKIRPMIAGGPPQAIRDVELAVEVRERLDEGDADGAARAAGQMTPGRFQARQEAKEEIAATVASQQIEADTFGIGGFRVPRTWVYVGAGVAGTLALFGFLYRWAR